MTEYGEAFIKNRMIDLVKKYLDAAGIDKVGSCKLFRISMATHMLENGADIRYIQMILGPVNLSSTQIYIQVTIKNLKQVHAVTHPAKLCRSSREGAKHPKGGGAEPPETTHQDRLGE